MLYEHNYKREFLSVNIDLENLIITFNGKFMSKKSKELTNY